MISKIENGKYNIDGRGFTTEELIEYYDELINKYSIISIFETSLPTVLPGTHCLNNMVSFSPK